jgi:hypothetical protein
MQRIMFITRHMYYLESFLIKNIKQRHCDVRSNRELYRDIYKADL